MTYKFSAYFSLALVLALCVVSASAAANTLYIVKDVAVDVTADNALEARDRAFAEAQVKAFRELSQRMLSEEELATLQIPEAHMISPLIQDFEVTREKLSDVRYIGTYTFRFKNDAVQDYFSSIGLAFTDVSSRPVLVLPFYQLGARTVLWSPYNIWKAAWDRVDNLRGLVPVVVPLGDLEDVKDIGDDDALNYNESGLLDMLERYGAGEAVLAIAFPDADPSQAGGESGAEAAGDITVNIYSTDRGQPELMRQIAVQAQAGKTMADLMEEGVRRVYSVLQRDWKSKTITGSQEDNVLQVSIPIQTLQEWAEIQKILNDVQGVRDIALRSITPGRAKVDLFFRGTETRLRLALRQSDLILSQPQFSAGHLQGGYGEGYYAPLIYELRLDRQGGS